MTTLEQEPTQRCIRSGVWHRGALFAAAAAAVLSGTPVLAGNVVLDGSVNASHSGALIKTGGVYTIPQDHGKTIGTNLLHSFSQFDLATASETALFTGSGVTNILSRVTGGAASSINGKIKSSIPGANLYLMNPKGVVFGDQASLDISGSFHVTTADYVQLGSAGAYYADRTVNSPLVSVDPTAFGFLTAAPAAITFAGTGFFDPFFGTNAPWYGKGMTVPNGKTLSVVGGDVSITSNQYGYGSVLQAKGGRLNLVSVAGTGEVKPTATGLGVDQAGGAITLSGNSVLRVSDTTAGTLFVRGGTLSMGSSDAAGSAGSFYAAPTGDGGGGLIDVLLDHELTMANGSQISINNFGGGTGGEIRVQAHDIALSSGSGITSNARALGRGAHVTVTTPGTLTLTGGNSAGHSYVSVGTSDAESGNLTIRAGHLELSEQAYVSSLSMGPGKGGEVTLMVGDATLNNGSLNTFSTAQGPGGSLRLESSGDLRITGSSGTISTEATGTGTGGAVTLETRGKILIQQDGAIKSKTSASGLGGAVTITTPGIMEIGSGGLDSGMVATITESNGTGGALRIRAGTVKIVEGGSISSATSTQGGTGGAVAVHAETITLNGGALWGADIISKAYNGGRGGDITVHADRDLIVDGQTSTFGAQIANYGWGASNSGAVAVTASDITLQHHGNMMASTENGIAGDVNVEAKRVTMLGGALRSSVSGSGRGGALNLTAKEAVSMAGDAKGSTVLSRVSQMDSLTTGAGHAGQINLTAPDVEIGDGGRIAATTGVGVAGEGTGQGGQITIHAERMRIHDGGFIASNSTSRGNAGRVALTVKELLEIRGHEGSINIPKEYPNGGIYAGTTGAGLGGDVTLSAANLEMTSGGRIDSSTSGAGRGGNIAITTSDTLSVAGKSATQAASVIAASTRGADSNAGAGGTLSIATPRLSLTDGGHIESSTSGFGAGGTIAVEVPVRMTLAGAGSGLFGNSTAAGAAGIITARSDSLSLSDHAEISTSGTGSGKAGDITLGLPLRRASVTSGASISSSNTGSGDAGSILLSASGALDLDQGSIQTEAAAGKGGSISLTVPLLSVAHNSQISASVLGGAGTGGRVGLDLTTLSLSNNSRVESSTAGTGTGGNITIRDDNTHIRSGSSIASNSTSLADGAGKAGSVTLLSRDTLIMEEGAVTSSAKKGGGGDISVQVQNMIRLTQSNISTSVQGGDGQGGNIAIDPIFLILKGSKVQANAFEGAGGRVTIQAQTLIKDSLSRMTASSALGIQGTVTVDAPDVNVVDSLSVLPTTFLDASALLGELCSPHREGGRSSFILKGRGGLPTMPDDLFSSHGVMDHDTPHD
ncbi:MAG: filamentous hemagglutinin N-terminal domain-containing protein [Magnetococcus sp. MYC-9]